MLGNIKDKKKIKNNNQQDLVIKKYSIVSENQIPKFP